MDFRKFCLLISIILYEFLYSEKYLWHILGVFLGTCFSYKTGFSIGFKYSFKEIHLDPSDVNNWNINSNIWNPVHYAVLKDYDYFTNQISIHLNIPPLYEYEDLNYPNPTSQVILKVCLNAYQEILLNGATFVYNLTPFESEVLGIDTISGDNVLDGLILNNTGTYHLRNYPYWIYEDNYFLSKRIFGTNNFACNYLVMGDRFDKIEEMMSHLAWIKGRFDRLNNNAYESNKMRKWMEYSSLLTLHHFLKNHWNALQNANVINNLPPYTNDYYTQCVFNTWDLFQDYRPNDLLERCLIRYEEQQIALEAEQEAGE